MNNLTIANKLELTLIPGNSVIVWNPDAFDEIALIECKKNRTNITLLEDSQILDSKDMRALTDEKIPKFSIDNDVLSSLLNRSSEIMEELITLFEEAKIDIITGKKPIEYYDEVVTKAYEMGYDVLEKEANEMYAK